MDSRSALVLHGIGVLTAAVDAGGRVLMREREGRGPRL